MALVDTLVALALVGSIVVAYMGCLGTTSRVTMTSHEEAVAESVARSQMEWAKTLPYVSGAASYVAGAIPPVSDYTGYSASISAAALHVPDDGIQKITITVTRNGTTVLSVDGYKVNR